jgi:hypothetical protein
MSTKYIFYLIFLISLVLSGCASFGSLTGGPIDRDPPELIPERSEPNFQTRFNKKTIILEFNEFIQVRNPVNEVVVSPPLSYLPQVKARAQKLIFEFNEKEILKPNATYSINFGEAISDFTEGNKLENFKFVFSTGDQIDTMKISGKVINAFSGAPEEEILVMLYNNLADSAVVKEKPFYYSRTNKSGEYSIENIRTDTFRMLALKDLNKNIIYNPPGEWIGFAENFIVFDTIESQKLDLVIAPPSVKRRVTERKQELAGRLNVLLNEKPDSILPHSIIPPDVKGQMTLRKDTLIYWYTEAPDSFQIAFSFDTIMVKSNLFTGKKPAKLSYDKSLLPRDIGVFEKFNVYFPHVIVDIMIDSIRFSYDSLKNEVAFDVNADTYGQLSFEAEWPEDKEITIMALPGSFTDVYGNINDTLTIKFKTLSESKFGEIVLDIKSLDSTMQYILELMEGDKFFHRKIIADVPEFQWVLLRQRPGTYSVVISEDANRNGKLDPADYWKQTQPEKRKKFDLENLKENWTLETELLWVAPEIIEEDEEEDINLDADSANEKNEDEEEDDDDKRNE